MADIILINPLFLLKIRLGKKKLYNIINRHRMYNKENAERKLKKWIYKNG